MDRYQSTNKIHICQKTNTLLFVKNTNLIASIQIKEDLWFFQIGMYLYSHVSSYRWRKLSLAERLCRLFPLLSFPLRTWKYWVLHMDYWSCYNIKFVCDSAKIKLFRIILFLHIGDSVSTKEYIRLGLPLFLVIPFELVLPV